MVATMRYIKFILFPLLACTAMLLGCGGGSSTPQSERNTYGRTSTELRQAPNVLSTSSGEVRLVAWARADSLYVPGSSRWVYDPITGAPSWDGFGTGTSFPTWYVVAALMDTTGTSVLTEWRPRTLWVVRWDELMSTRDLDASSTHFGDAFPNPPFDSSGAVVVVEFVNGLDARLLSASIVWAP